MCQIMLRGREGGRVPWSGSDHAGRGHESGQIMQGEDWRGSGHAKMLGKGGRGGGYEVCQIMPEGRGVHEVGQIIQGEDTK